MILENKATLDVEFDAQEERHHVFSALLSDLYLLQVRHDERGSNNFKLLDLSGKVEPYKFALGDKFCQTFEGLLPGGQRIAGFSERAPGYNNRNEEVAREYFRIAFIKTNVKKSISIIKLKKQGRAWQEKNSEKVFEVPTLPAYADCLDEQLHVYEQRVEGGKTYTSLLYVQAVPGRIRAVVYDIYTCNAIRSEDRDLAYIFKDADLAVFDIKAMVYDKLSKTVYILYANNDRPACPALVTYNVEKDVATRYNIELKSADIIVNALTLAGERFYLLCNSNSQTSSKIVQVDLQFMNAVQSNEFESFKMGGGLTLRRFKHSVGDKFRAYTSVTIYNSVLDGTWIVDKAQMSFAALDLIDSTFYIIGRLGGKSSVKTFAAKNRLTEHSNFMVSSDRRVFVEFDDYNFRLNNASDDKLACNMLSFADKKCVYAFLLNEYNARRLGGKLKDSCVAKMISMFNNC